MSVSSIALSGMQAAAARLGASASNVANMEVRGAVPDAAPDDAKQVYRPVSVQAWAAPGGGVVTTLVRTEPGWTAAYDPDAPYADAGGMVAAPAVDLGFETADQIGAMAQFTANLKVLQADAEMQRRVLDLKR